ncbi:hypothetical protein T492DRAFT_26696 [Pavlovales sp. CCMP2436]|nr:hypothetical protein T492DRAFT_26696 [Pavlovales sp. CCMP2436]
MAHRPHRQHQERGLAHYQRAGPVRSVVRGVEGCRRFVHHRRGLGQADHVPRSREVDRRTVLHARHRRVRQVLPHEVPGRDRGAAPQGHGQSRVPLRAHSPARDRRAPDGGLRCAGVDCSRHGRVPGRWHEPTRDRWEQQLWRGALSANGSRAAFGRVGRAHQGYEGGQKGEEVQAPPSERRARCQSRCAELGRVGRHVYHDVKLKRYNSGIPVFKCG